jgi:transposase
MVPARVAAHSKKVRQERGNVLFFDESGLLMAPLVRRTWARRGKTPQLLQRGRHREKISLAAALWLSPDGEPQRLSYRSLANGHFDSVAVATFLEELITQTSRSLTVVWDGGTMHRGEPIRKLLSRTNGQLRLERLPAYAPMLNPVEQLWSWLKFGRLSNFAPITLDDLRDAIHRELRSAQRNQHRIHSLWNACDLATSRTLLF